MPGRKRAKIREAAAALFSPPPPAPVQPEDDDGLMDDLMAQLDERDEANKRETAQVLKEVDNANNEGGTLKKKQDSKSRFEARLARKAAELAASYAPSDPSADERIAKEAKDEEASIAATCNSLNLEVFPCAPDGHCLFHAVADQLHILGLLPEAQVSPMTTRHAASMYMANHSDEFLPFLPSVEGEDGAGATEGGLMNPDQFRQYCQTIAETSAWGGQPEIMALAKAFGVEIDVVQAGEPPIVKTMPFDGPQGKHLPVARISYHRRMYGLGEHYNSLRPRRTAAL